MKVSGEYYTPDILADFILKWLSLRIDDCDAKLLEPSCGDGVFLRSLERRSTIKLSIDAVEISQRALIAAQKSTASSRIKFWNSDFLDFESPNRYDVVIGNPPYIAKRLLSKTQIRKCEEVYRESGIIKVNIQNIWTAFLLKAERHLTDDGVLAFVLPSELLQVNYSSIVRQFLVDHFSRIEIFTFERLVFPGIGQDTILLFAYKESNNPGVFFSSVYDLNALERGEFTKWSAPYSEGSNEKWTGSSLGSDDFQVLRSACSRAAMVCDHSSSVAGIVTAANNYFIVNRDTVEKFDLQQFCLPIIQRGQFVNGDVVFSRASFGELVHSGRPCYLVDFSGHKTRDLSSPQKRYLAKGRDCAVNLRYKCSQRDRWFDVPSIWKSEVIFFKRCHHYPKLLRNDADVYVTDSAYRVKLNEGIDPSSFVYSFYNSLTLCMAELRGRFYGGGVLELTPNEFKKLPLPYVHVSSADFEKFRVNFSRKKSIECVLEQNDVQILEGFLGLSSEEVRVVKDCRERLLSRRLRAKLRE